jgi:hypothetical protein
MEYGEISLIVGYMKHPIPHLVCRISWTFFLFFVYDMDRKTYIRRIAHIGNGIEDHKPNR